MKRRLLPARWKMIRIAFLPLMKFLPVMVSSALIETPSFGLTSVITGSFFAAFAGCASSAKAAIVAIAAASMRVVFLTDLVELILSTCGVRGVGCMRAECAALAIDRTATGL